MKQLAILSGKGGTGKTSVTAALAHLAGGGPAPLRTVLVDADVDAANLELVLAPEQQEAHDFIAGQAAVVDPALCTACGTCAEVCRFEAVAPADTVYRVDASACEGCAACVYRCPAEAIRMETRQAGRWFRSDTRFGPLFHAHLFAGQENSGKLVTLVKQQGRLRALDAGADLLLVDGPPGIGCPVISTLAGADLALLVTEPTLAGAHDLDRILSLADHFSVPALVLINKADLNPARSEEIAAACAARAVPVVGHIPYDTVVTEAMLRGLPVTAYADGAVGQAFRDAWRQVRERLLLSEVERGG